MRIVLNLFLLIGSSGIFAQTADQYPGVVSCPSLIYPKESQVRNEEGSVDLYFKVKSDASVGEILIRKSSGFSALDEGAINYIKSCKFSAGVKDSVSVDSFISQKITYNLTDFNNKKQDQEKLRAQNLERIAQFSKPINSYPIGDSAYRPTAGYPTLIAQRIKPYIILPKDVVGNPLAEVEVKSALDGSIVGVRLVTSSGNVDWDQSVLKAVIRAKSLPLDSNGKVPEILIVRFRPFD